MFTETDHPFPPAAPAPRCLPGGATLAVLSIRDNLRRAMKNLDDRETNRARRRMNRQAVVSCELLPLAPHCDDCGRDADVCVCYRQDPLYALLDSCDL